MSVNNELAHYGVKGMRWGVRRNKTSGDSKTKSSTEKSKILQNKIAKTALYTVGTVAVSYAGVKFATSPKVRSAIGKAMDRVGKLKVSEARKTADSLSGIYSKKLGREFTVAEAIARGLTDLI